MFDFASFTNNAMKEYVRDSVRDIAKKKNLKYRMTMNHGSDIYEFSHWGKSEVIADINVFWNNIEYTPKELVKKIEEVVDEKLHKEKTNTFMELLGEAPLYPHSAIEQYVKNDIEMTKAMYKHIINSRFGANGDVGYGGTHMLGINHCYGMTKTNNGVPTIKDVIFNEPATIVFWSDGSKTVVKAQDDEEFDPEKGLAMAISKKALGNKGSYFDVIKKHVDKYYDDLTYDIETSADEKMFGLHDLCESMKRLNAALNGKKRTNPVEKAYKYLVQCRDAGDNKEVPVDIDMVIGLLGEALDN